MMRKIKTLLIFLLLSSFCATTIAATTTISNLPIANQIAVEPNLIFTLDDSGSMDFEVLLNTNDGALWWDASVTSFTDSTGKFWFNTNGNTGIDGTHTWYKYVYLFPDGSSATDDRTYGDNSDGIYAHFAIPPTPAYAFLRSSDYNPLYYNTNINYSSWTPAYINGATQTFANASATSARSHPVFPIGGTPITLNLTTNQSSINSDWTFRMLPGMVVPGATISGIQASKNGGSWQNISTDQTVPNGSTWDVNIPYYPATFYVKDATCTGSAPTCVTAPDGKQLRRYEIKSGNTFPSGRTYANELQNFANWFTYYRKRKLMLAGSLGQVVSQLSSIRGGFIRINNLSPVTMYDFNSANPSQNGQVVLGQVYQNPANGGTPTRDALNYVGNQFMTNTGIIQYGCQVNAAIVMTDGFATVSNPTVPSYNQATWGGTSPYTTTYPQTLADIALAYYTLNLRGDLPAGLVPNNATDTSPSADKNPNLHMITYALGLGVQGTIFGTGTPQATDPYNNPPTWPNPTINRSPTAVDDLWHATLNSRGLMFSASDSNLVSSVLQTLIGDAVLKSGTNSNLTITNVNVNTSNNIAYASSYSGFYGDLYPVTINPTTGQITNPQTWSARTLLDNRLSNNRYIATYDSNSRVGIPFQWANLTSTMQTKLNSTASPPGPADGQNVLAWIRGDKSLEGIAYRSRVHLLGDIVDSSAVLVAGATGNYADTGYTSFAASVTNRTPTLYQGANDGMLHAFNARTGQETWAYVPSFVLSNLPLLANKSYTHLFFVDGTPTAGDVPNASNIWRTILVGGLNAGGKGFYALDITNPAQSSDASAAASVMWEFPNSSTPTSVANNVGLSFGNPIIAKTIAYGWVVLVTSGYNNTSGDGKGHLFVLDANTGALIKDIATTSGSATSPSGLARISAFAKNGPNDATIDYVYGGDLNGNLWRFDLSGNSVNNWNVALLAQLVTAGGAPQPITSAPELTQTSNHRMVFVGTGQLLGIPDLTNTQSQSFYGLVDNQTSNPTITNLRSNLKQQIVSGNSISSNTVDYTTLRGWYFDLPGSGERVSSDPVIALGFLVFNSNLPSAAGCSAKSFEYIIDPNTGGQISGAGTGDIPPAIIAIGASFSTQPTIVVLSNNKVVSLSHNSDNSIATINLPPPTINTITRKVAWKEVLIN